MSNALQVFDFNEQKVRVIMQNNEPWFVAKDVCDVLEIANALDAVSMLDDDEKADVGISDGSQKRHMNVINESGLYTLIMRSNKPEAKKFRKWVTSEVLPSIRKTGRYELPKHEQPKIDPGLVTAAKIIFETADIKGNQLTLALDKVYKHYTGESALATGDIELIAENKEQYLTPTEIGLELGLSAQKINSMLFDLGYQRKINNTWECCEAGDGYAVMLDVGKRHSDETPVKQLKWRSSVIKVLENYLE